MGEGLTICSVAYNDRLTGLLDLMIGSVIKNTELMPKFVICDSGGNDLSKYKSSNFTIISNPNRAANGSLQHGCGLNAALSLVKTTYVAIIESDCVVLSKDWSNLHGRKLLAAPKGTGLYHTCFLVGETALLCGVDFRPGTNKTRSNRPYKAEEDVGWDLENHISEEQVSKIDFVDCKTDKAKIFKYFQSDEFHKGGKLIAAHFGRGSNLAGKAIKKGFSSPAKQLEDWKTIADKLIMKEEEK